MLESLSLYDDILCPECLSTLTVGASGDKVNISHDLVNPQSRECSRRFQNVIVKARRLLASTGMEGVSFVQIPSTVCECGKLFDRKGLGDGIRIKFYHRSTYPPRHLDRDHCPIEITRPVAYYMIFIEALQVTNRTVLQEYEKAKD